MAEQGTQMTPVAEQVVENYTGRLSMIAKVNETGVQVSTEDAATLLLTFSKGDPWPWRTSSGADSR